MKKIALLSLLIISCISYAQKIPTIQKTEFSKEALAQKVQNENGKEITLQSIINQHKGKVLVIDFWAGWCKDCILALPKAKELEASNPNVDFIFLSLERNKESFIKNIDRFNLTGKENYWFYSGWKNSFNDYIDLNWIPRYIIIDQKSNIAKYYAISPEDPEIQKTIDQLLK